jgi:hypothetical protein
MGESQFIGGRPSKGALKNGGTTDKIGGREKEGSTDAAHSLPEMPQNTPEEVRRTRTFERCGAWSDPASGKSASWPGLPLSRVPHAAKVDAPRLSPTTLVHRPSPIRFLELTNSENCEPELPDSFLGNVGKVWNGSLRLR